VPSGTTLDGELVVVSERDGKPAQDFAAVTRAVFTGRPAATETTPGCRASVVTGHRVSTVALSAETDLG
jgi:hypothetical protein